MLDTIVFGDAVSESNHSFFGPLTALCETCENKSSRIALPTVPPSRFGGEYTFTMKVDPFLQNYISVKMWSGDKYTPTFLYIDGKQVGYCKSGDFEALNLGFGDFSPHRFFYVTESIPLWYTKGKTSITLSIRQGESYDTLTQINGRMFSAHTHTDAWLDKIEQNAPLKSTSSLEYKNYSRDEIDSICNQYITKQQEAFIRSLASLRAGEKISVTKYVEHFRQFCMILFEPYCPAVSDNEKGECVSLLLNCIDLYIHDYFADVRTLAHTSHQSDWGGYYAELGQGLYIIEPLIKNEKIYGEKKFYEYLNAPFDFCTIESEFSLSGRNLTRREAWELCFKASFDFASARQSYIYNQTYYTYEGAWKAMAGLGVIDSQYYIGKEKCERILLETLGMAPWHGEHILTDQNGRDLDLYHCLFHHDNGAVFTDDFIQVVCRGLAVQKLDENGNFVRRKPYGENYFPLTLEAMPRENGYVANYGETLNYYPEWVYRTWNHGDRDLSDKIMKTALLNIHSRSFMRYQSVDKDNNRIMHMEQGTDERNASMPGKIAYGPDINDTRTFLFVSIKRHMEENPERYQSKEWDIYKKYASDAVDFTRQQRLDGRLDFYLENIGESYNDFRIDRSVRDIFSNPLKAVVPHTDFSFYREGELDINPEDYAEFAWTDIDNLTVSLRDDSENIHFFAQLNLRNRGYGAVGKAHVRHGNNVQFVQLTTDGIFEYGGKFIRQQNVNMDFISDAEGCKAFNTAPTPLEEFGATVQALCGEEQTITYQKGIGKVLRENYEVDTPYSGYPDVIWSRLGKYFMLFNTTRESYQNAKTFTVRVPEKGMLYDFVSKSFINAENGEITIPPLTAYVLKLSSEVSEYHIPNRVNVINVLPDSKGNFIQWKITSGGEKYNLYRSTGNEYTLLTTTDENIFLDTAVVRGKTYYYKVSAVNKFGVGNLSYEKSVIAQISDNAFIPASIGASGGNYSVSDDKIIISDGRGTGFGTGDDYHALERDIRDCVSYAAKVVCGSVSISAKIDGAGGIMFRENSNENARYVYLGFDEDGKILLHTRSKNTIWNPRGKLSPLAFSFDGGNYSYLKLLRDDDLHSVAAYASSDGVTWNFIDRDIIPFPGILYAGVATLMEAHFSDITVNAETLDLPFPIRSVTAERNGGECTLHISKGLDNRTLIIMRSQDNSIFETIATDVFSHTYTDTACPKGDVWYKVIPVNRHGICGDGVCVKA